MFYRLAKARSVWKLIGDLSHYPEIILVDFDVLVMVIMVCIDGLVLNDLVVMVDMYVLNDQFGMLECDLIYGQ